MSRGLPTSVMASWSGRLMRSTVGIMVVRRSSASHPQDLLKLDDRDPKLPGHPLLIGLAGFGEFLRSRSSLRSSLVLIGSEPPFPLRPHRLPESRLPFRAPHIVVPG